jgi:23S rRNA (cytosine1962-C5)-methyltransferase
LFTPDQYQLLDFGHGRRLERFGGITLDRPCPAAEGIPPADPHAWQNADARFERGEGEEGQWSSRRELPEQWSITHDPLLLELKRTPLGQVGLFPEQAENWDWLGQAIQAAARPLKVLNLFAYTGGSTLAAAAAGAEVFHVDAARNTVAWARRNAELSGMAALPIHWLTEDALKFVKRELKRGNRYDAVILDPPSYGHGPRGEVWRLGKHLPRLLAICGELTAGRRRFMLLTCHTPGFDPARLKDMMSAAPDPDDNGVVIARQLTLRSAAGCELPCGVVVRWQRSPLPLGEG